MTFIQKIKEKITYTSCLDSNSSIFALCKTLAICACSSLLKWLTSGSSFCILADLGIEFGKKDVRESIFGVVG